MRTAAHPLGILTLHWSVELLPRATVERLAVKLPLASVRQRLRGGSPPLSFLEASAEVASPVSSDSSSSGAASTAQPIASTAFRERMTVDAVIR